MSKPDLSVNQQPRFEDPFHGWRSVQEIKRIGNYRLLEPIGSGNFGIVFSAEHIHLHQQAAVKIFKRIGNDAETLRAFVRSARYLSALDHPNIVRMHEFGVIKKNAYLVMDLIAPGASIDLLFSRMPLKAIIELLIQIAGAMEYAHNAEFRDENGRLHRGIYHGDIKPANILVDNDRAYLTDFMLPNMHEFERRAHGHPCFPFHDTRCYGTPMYMAPEQICGIVNTQTDIFAFGVTSYELLTGKYPWNTEGDFASQADFEGRRADPPTPITVRNTAVPETLGNVVGACISLHPGDRPKDFGEIRRVLEETLRRPNPLKAVHRGESDQKAYDVALSFAGSERPLAEQIYLKLREHCQVFYDQAPREKADLWGADLSVYLHDVYANQARYCVVLVSKEYIDRAWTSWERRAILQRMVSSRTDQYVLPVLVENVEIPGLPRTIGMLNLHEEGVDGVVAALLLKIGMRCNT